MFTAPLQCRFGAICDGDKIHPGPASYTALIVLFVLSALLARCLAQRTDRMLKSSATATKKHALSKGATLLLGADFISETPSVKVVFSDVGMVLKASKKVVLSGITGRFPAGSLVALMGPSGGGKTTFMNALLGRANYGDVIGDIYVNDTPGGLPPSLVGFVPQDDVVHANLTVYENLYYNAMLRLPAAASNEHKVKHVVHTLSVLGIMHIKDSLVGDARRRGVSGGQKKRVNIGMELAAMPAIIFMDEPTSGLDGAATVQLAECLAQLRLSGLTIICVIHQPRLRVFMAFSHVLLLGAGGRQVYCGCTANIEPYLVSSGFRLPERENLADCTLPRTKQKPAAPPNP